MKDRFWQVYYWIMIVFLALGSLELLWILDMGYESYFRFEGSIYGIEIGFPLVFIFLVMTLVRYVTIGKHFWNKP